MQGNLRDIIIHIPAYILSLRRGGQPTITMYMYMWWLTEVDIWGLASCVDTVDPTDDALCAESRNE